MRAAGGRFRPDASIVGGYLIGTGSPRFFIEFIRVNERVAFGLTVAHLVSLAAIAVGISMLVFRQTSRARRLGTSV